MRLSDLSVERPVFAAVLSLLLIAFGLIAYSKLPLREYPDINPPVISIETAYRGAAAKVVETRVTEPIEGRIAGIEGVRSISSQSKDGASRVTVEFALSRDIDDAANDLRDRVSGLLDDLPEEADPPEISKANSDDQVILWFNLAGEGMTVMQLTDYARRFIQDRFSSLDGVARVRVGGSQDTAMRIWLDVDKLAARNLTVAEVQRALRSENIELPAGSIESKNRDFTVNMLRSFHSTEDFRQLVLARGDDGYLVRLGDVAEVEIAPAESRNTLRGNGVAMVGIGIIKQSQANTLSVARLARERMQKVNASLPQHIQLKESYDSSVFIEASIREVFKTLGIAIALVVLVILVFLGNLRAMLIPAVAVPVSLVATFIVLYALGYTLNLLTLLALVLAIGLVVDDAIVMLENIHRRVELGEPPLLAAYRGSKQVAFAIIATTVVLVSVFIPITFLGGNLGRLFTEFAVAISAAVIFSTFVALSLSPMLASKLLRPRHAHAGVSNWMDQRFEQLRRGYLKVLGGVLDRPLICIVILLATLMSSAWLLREIPQEFTPPEDRGAFFMMIRGPEGASYNYMMEHVDEIERRLMPFVESGEFERLLLRAPGRFGAGDSFSDAIGIIVLDDWNSGRKPIWYYLGKVRELTGDLSGVRIFPIVRQPLGSRTGKPVQFVLGGPSYDQLAEWRDVLIEKARDLPGLTGVNHDYLVTRPQVGVQIHRDRAADLGVSVEEINRTLETLLGSRRVTTFIDRGEEYNVILESRKDRKNTPSDISKLYVRSASTGALIPLSNLVSITEYAAAPALNRYNRLRSITIDANLADGYALGEALDDLDRLVREHLPSGPHVDYKGSSRELRDAGAAVLPVFMLSLLVVYLVLAGQFESFVHPLIIMLTVPLAMSGALGGLWLTGQSLNIYSEIGLIILVGLSAKNGILIVEFANQLRDEGLAFRDAILDASGKRLRPIIMTGITTAMGGVPLILAFGAGAETRSVIGIVIVSGVLVATVFTLLVVPAMYNLLARNTGSPKANSRRLEQMLESSQNVTGDKADPDFH